ncbi:MAG: glycosyltransferase family 9 protein [Kiritimatiellae bacterium]|nr:glycosyltransferase family 9 protein [Kiritimatiellia bacterium]
MLVMRGGALGDFILTLPAIAALRQRCPRARIELAAHEKHAQLAMITGIIDSIKPLDSAGMAFYFQDESPLPPAEQEYIRSFDLIISFLHDPDAVLRRNLVSSGGKRVISVSPLVKKGHAADHFMAAIKDAFRRVSPAINAPEDPPVLPAWPDYLKKNARQRLRHATGGKDVFIIHPGSGSPAKNWAGEKYAALAKRIADETELAPLVIGGEADGEAVASILKLFPECKTLVNPPLMETASVLSAARGFAGNDSGVTHLAAALGIPVVAIFGPTDPAVWSPRGKNVLIMRGQASGAERFRGITVESVFSALKTKLFSPVPAAD